MTNTNTENKMIILENGGKFDPATHTYYNKEGLIRPSVNQILNAVYGSGVENIPADILQKAAERGTAIHADMANAINAFRLKIDYEPENAETKTFLTWAQKNIDNLANSSCEGVLFCETENDSKLKGQVEFAGTYDLICDNVLYDFKTSRNINKDMLKKWQMQLSFYYYWLKYCALKEPKKMGVLHLTENECEPIELEYLGDAFVLETLRKFYNGETELATKEVKTSLANIAEHELKAFEIAIKNIAKLEDTIAPLRERIKEEMEKNNILTLQLGDVMISYVAPTTRKSFDSARFKAEHADLFGEYQKESSVKSSIRIKIK